jgi:hypothetical protein
VGEQRHARRRDGADVITEAEYRRQAAESVDWLVETSHELGVQPEFDREREPGTPALSAGQLVR